MPAAPEPAMEPVEPAEHRAVGAPEPDASVAVLPAEHGDFAPSHVRLAPGDPADVNQLADVETCEGCHQDVVAHWRSSAHSRSSFDNTWYRQAVDAFRAEVGPEASRFCAGCHDPLLLVSGAMAEPEVRADDPRAHAGITCAVCHGIVETRADGNGSYTLSTAPIPLPVQGDAQSLEDHLDRVRPDPLDTANMCGSCHRVFLHEGLGNPHFLPGLDQLGPWRASVYGGSLTQRLDEEVKEATCQQCHMADEAAPLGDVVARGTGTVRSHRFPGGQTALAAASGDPAQLEAVRGMLQRAATIDVPALTVLTNPARVRRSLPADGARIRPGDRVALDVVVRNVGAGHFFPGGVRDTQDVWVELRITDASGETLAEAGTENERGDDPTTHRLIQLMLDEEGLAERRHHPHRFAASAYDHTVPARGARVVRYVTELPRSLRRADFPLRVQATLRHRRHVADLARSACDASRSRRGREFLRASRELDRGPVDGCVPQPLTDVASAVVFLGPGADEREAQGGAARPGWRRLWEHALGLVGDLQERVADAGPSIDRALELLPEEATDRERAMLLALRAELAGRQGRADEAAQWADRAEELFGPHPALDRIRGDAMARVWRWEEAEASFARVTETTPSWGEGWRALAGARGSLMLDEAALEATRRGLELLPRDEWLLRTQAVALENLGDPDAARAREAFVHHRRPDNAHQLRYLCDARVPGCAQQRVPVPTVEMRAR